jgi:hypothetical protein
MEGVSKPVYGRRLGPKELAPPPPRPPLVVEFNLTRPHTPLWERGWCLNKWLRVSGPVEVFPRKCCAFGTAVTVWPLDSVECDVARCELGLVLTFCSSRCVVVVGAALHRTQSRVHTYRLLCLLQQICSSYKHKLSAVGT